MSPASPTPLTNESLARALRASDLRPRERTGECPDEQAIAAYADGSVGPTERETIEAHLANCAACLALVGLLARDAETSEEAAVPEATVARVRELVRPAVPVRRVPRWAAAAAVLAVIPVLLQLYRAADESPAAGDESAPRITRSAPPPARDGLQVVRPAAGSVVEPQELIIRWSPVPGSLYYDVRIVTESGVPVLEQRVTGTEWRPDASVRLRPGAGYYVRVDAYPADGRPVSSVHVPFAVRQ